MGAGSEAINPVAAANGFGANGKASASVEGFSVCSRFRVWRVHLVIFTPNAVQSS